MGAPHDQASHPGTARVGRVLLRNRVSADTRIGQVQLDWNAKNVMGRGSYVTASSGATRYDRLCILPPASFAQLLSPSFNVLIILGYPIAPKSVKTVNVMTMSPPAPIDTTMLFKRPVSEGQAPSQKAAHARAKTARSRIQHDARPGSAAVPRRLFEQSLRMGN